MKGFLQHISKRWEYDGWALRHKGASRAMTWSVCTTRAEARQLRIERGDLFERGAEVVKVKISVEVV